MKPAEAGTLRHPALALYHGPALEWLRCKLVGEQHEKITTQQVFALFVDVAGYSKFSKRNDPGDVKNLERAVWNPSINVVLAHNGQPISIPGDALMSIFPGEGGFERACAASEELLGLKAHFADNLRGSNIVLQDREIKEVKYSGVGAQLPMVMAEVGNELFLIFGTALDQMEKLVGDDQFVLRDDKGKDLLITKGKVRDIVELEKLAKKGERSQKLAVVDRLLSEKPVHDAEEIVLKHLPPYLAKMMREKGCLPDIFEDMTILFGRVYIPGRGYGPEKIGGMEKFGNSLKSTMGGFGGDIISYDSSFFISIFRGKDHAKRALLAETELRSGYGTVVDLQNGIESGQAILTEIGTRDVMQFYTVLGHPVNVAARNMQIGYAGVLSKPPGIYEDIGATAKGRLVLPLDRGKSVCIIRRDSAIGKISEGEEFGAYRKNVAPAPEPSILNPALKKEVSGALVGRKNELGAVHALLEKSGTVYVSGSSGVGKSALLANAAESALAECPYRREPFATALKFVAEHGGGPALTQKQAEAVKAMAGLASGTGEMDSATRKQKFEDEFVTFISEMKARRIAIDNMSHMDFESQLIFGAAKRAGKQVLFEYDKNMGHAGAELKLGGLDKDAANLLLASELGKRGFRKQPGAEIAEIAATGNPRFIIGVVREGTRLGYFSQTGKKTVLSEQGRRGLKTLMGKSELERKKDIISSHSEFEKCALKAICAAGKEVTVQEAAEIAKLLDKTTMQTGVSLASESLVESGMLMKKDGKLWFADESSREAVEKSLWTVSHLREFNYGIAGHLRQKAEKGGMKFEDMESGKQISRASEVREITDHMLRSHMHEEAAAWGLACAKMHEKISAWSAHGYYLEAAKALHRHIKTTLDEGKKGRARGQMFLALGSAYLCRSEFETGNKKLIGMMSGLMNGARKQGLGINAELAAKNARLLFRLKEYPAAIRAVEEAKKEGSKGVFGDELDNLEITSLAKSGQVKKAKESMDELVAKRGTPQSLDGLTTFFNVEFALGSHSRALGFAQAALDKAMEEKNAIKEGVCWELVGLCHKKMGNLGHASEAYGKAVQIYAAAREFAKMANLYSNIGNVKINQKDFDGADEAYMTGMSMALEMPERIPETTVALLKANYFDSAVNRPDLDEAEAGGRYNDALASCESSGVAEKEPDSKIELMLSFADFCIRLAGKGGTERLQHFGKATETLLETKEFCKARGIPLDTGFYERLLVCERELGNHTIAERLVLEAEAALGPDEGAKLRRLLK